jgi:hypothetical protein
MMQRQETVMESHMPLTIGVPRETAAGEKRVATVPEVVEKLIKLGFASPSNRALAMQPIYRTTPIVLPAPRLSPMQPGYGRRRTSSSRYAGRQQQKSA